MDRFIAAIKEVYGRIVGIFKRRQNHKLVVDSECKECCRCLCVYNEKEASEDSADTDISISPTEQGAEGGRPAFQVRVK